MLFISGFLFPFTENDHFSSVMNWDFGYFAFTYVKRTKYLSNNKKSKLLE
jgi:hypothetical protein